MSVCLSLLLCISFFIYLQPGEPISDSVKASLIQFANIHLASTALPNDIPWVSLENVFFTNIVSQYPELKYLMPYNKRYSISEVLLAWMRYYSICVSVYPSINQNRSVC